VTGASFSKHGQVKGYFNKEYIKTVIFLNITQQEEKMNILDTTVQTTNITPFEKGHSEQKLKTACQEFESFFINALLKSADKANPKCGLFNDKKDSDMYSSMMNMEFAKSISQGGGMGLGDILFQQLKSSK
jgi:flagellar protein FlgJ